MEVAPFAGAWIEIVNTICITGFLVSLPSRERGLKCLVEPYEAGVNDVAPFAGAWIEISEKAN